MGTTAWWRWNQIIEHLGLWNARNLTMHCLNERKNSSYVITSTGNGATFCHTKLPLQNYGSTNFIKSIQRYSDELYLERNKEKATIYGPNWRHGFESDERKHLQNWPLRRRDRSPKRLPRQSAGLHQASWTNSVHGYLRFREQNVRVRGKKRLWVVPAGWRLSPRRGEEPTPDDHVHRQTSIGQPPGHE